MSATPDPASKVALAHLRAMGEPPLPGVPPLVHLAMVAADGAVLARLYELARRPGAVELVVPDWPALDSGEEPLAAQLAALAARLEGLPPDRAAAVLAGNVADSLPLKYPDFAPQ